MPPANEYRSSIPLERPVPSAGANESVTGASRLPLFCRGIFAAIALIVLAGSSAVGQSRADGPGLLVLAAASLADVLPPLAAEWSETTGVPVRFSFDATSRLAPQAVAGAPADVFVSADETWMRWLSARELVSSGSERLIAANELVVVVPLGAAARPDGSAITGARTLGLAGENVPAGRYAREALRSTGTWPDVEDRVVSGGSVRGVLEWVARGEVDAGVVYRTDALADTNVTVAFGFTTADHSPIGYWAAPLTASATPVDAARFVDFLASAAGADGFTSAGFSRVLDDSARRAAAPQAGVPETTLPSVGSAIRLSLLVALLATAAGLIPSIALGWLLARHDFRGKVFVSTLVLAPLVIPPVVTGFLLLTLLGSQSPVGGVLARLGLPVPFTILGAAVAALIVGLPLYVLSIRGAFEAIDPLYEELSWTLGHPPRRTFLRVSLPLALPGIAAGAILAFARSLGEFGATVVLAGNVEGSTRTIALAVYTLLESPAGREATWTLVGASVALSLMALVGYETLSRRQRRRLSEDHGR